MNQELNRELFREYVLSLSEKDPAHDIAHIERVVANAECLLNVEQAEREIVQAAAWLHDCIVLPKDHPDRSRTSFFAAEKAEAFLRENSFPSEKIGAVKHAIEAHSFSAGIAPETIEAKIVQDADRLDALGAIGIARCLLVGGALNRTLYHPLEPFPERRTPDDSRWTIDHFYSKLFTLPQKMQTRSGREEAGKRVAKMKRFLEELSEEITLK